MSHGPVVRYLSHPQVLIDPAVPVPDWGLSDVGTARVRALCDGIASSTLAQTRAVFSSPERKALDTAQAIANALKCEVQVINNSHENDRSSTGYLPGPAFEDMANAFFSQPDRSARGWERATDAQRRITACLHHVHATAPEGDVLMVGHGAVGTLLYCAQAGIPISRAQDQGPGGGGNVIAYTRNTLAPLYHWTPMETLFAPSIREDTA